MKTIFSVLLCFVLISAYGQAITEKKSIESDLLYFENALALRLKKNVKNRDLAKIKNESLRHVAEHLLAKKYDSHYRMEEYHAVLDPAILGQKLGIGDGYSKYENVTGIYLPEGKHIVLAQNIGDKKVKLVVPHWLRKAPEGMDPTKDPNGWGLHKVEFDLTDGVNIIDLNKWGGLAYIHYFSSEPEKETSIKVHFPNAQVNGYFDIRKHSNKDWDRLLENAVYPIMDGLGKYVQIAYPVADCKKYAANLGVELISNYDSMIHLQHQLMGLVKYNKVPKNRILSRVNYNYYMFRDGDGVAYMGGQPGNAMHLVVDPARVIKGDPCWGFSHEVGHVHQLRPQFNYGGLGEVSNNVYSLFVNIHFGTKSRIKDQNNYNKSRERIINEKISYLQDEDVFNRLVPFWQLQLYFAGEGKNPDFYPDLFEAFRNQIAAEQKGSTDRPRGFMTRNGNPAEYQLNFIKTACVVSKTDLTEFFDLYGFFYVGKLEYNDYGKYTYNMTQQMVDDCKNAIKAMNLPKPKVDISRLEDAF